MSGPVAICRIIRVYVELPVVHYKCININTLKSLKVVWGVEVPEAGESRDFEPRKSNPLLLIPWTSTVVHADT